MFQHAYKLYLRKPELQNKTKKNSEVKTQSDLENGKIQDFKCASVVHSKLFSSCRFPPLTSQQAAKLIAIVCYREVRSITTSPSGCKCSLSLWLQLLVP